MKKLIKLVWIINMFTKDLIVEIDNLKTFI